MLTVSATTLTCASGLLYSVVAAGLWTPLMPDRDMGDIRSAAATTAIMATILWSVRVLARRDARARERERLLARVIDAQDGGGHPSGPFRSVR